jgi:hypothetical protein
MYWAFADLINVLNYGDVVFLPTPFYHSISRHWEGESREQVGNVQAVTEWDLYRGGLEYLILRAFQYAGFATIPAEQKLATHVMVDDFVNARMKVALRLSVARGDVISGHDLLARLMFHGALEQTDQDLYRSHLLERASLAAFVQTFNSLTHTRCIGLFANGDPAAVRSLLNEIDPRLPVTSLDDQDVSALPNKEEYLVLTGTDARARLIELGFPPGQVWSESDLLRQFSL